MTQFLYTGTQFEDDINTSDLQGLHPGHTDGFEVQGLEGDDTLTSSFVGRNGVDFIDGGPGNDL